MTKLEQIELLEAKVKELEISSKDVEILVSHHNKNVLLGIKNKTHKTDKLESYYYLKVQNK